MTKFIDKIANIQFHGIDNNEINYLLHKLELFLKNNEKSVSIITDKFQKSKTAYRIVELSDAFTIVLNQHKTKRIILNIGYPFPIFSKDIDSARYDFANNVEIKLFIRGKVLRKMQRDYLKKAFSDSFLGNKWIVISKIEKFRSLSSSFLIGKKRIIYIDPYHFIGDAFTGIYFLDRVGQQNKIKSIVVLSRFFKHLNLFYKSYEKNSRILRKMCISESIIIMPDLIDNHFGENIELLEAIKDKDVTIFVPGRNLIIHYEKSKVVIYHFDKDDVLLKNKNIEDYMDDCLSPFLENQPKRVYKKKNIPHLDGIAKIFISPYSSDPLKEISVEFFLKIACDLLENIDVKFIISKSNGAQDSKNKWIDKLLQKSKIRRYQKVLSKIDFISDKNISDLGKKLLNEHVICALVADTSISHALSRLMIPNITMYNECFWDKKSKQSLSAESPVGFCRYYFPQFAAILSKDADQNKFLSNIKNGLQMMLQILMGNTGMSVDKIPKEIFEFHNIVRSFVESPIRSLTYRNHKKLYDKYLILKKHSVHSEFAWLFDVYDPDQLIDDINKYTNKGSGFLIYSSWKNLPLYKFIDYFGDQKIHKNFNSVYKSPSVSSWDGNVPNSSLVSKARRERKP